jgi:hypothetical protein
VCNQWSKDTWADEPRNGLVNLKIGQTRRIRAIAINPRSDFSQCMVFRNVDTNNAIQVSVGAPVFVDWETDFINACTIPYEYDDGSGSIISPYRSVVRNLKVESTGIAGTGATFNPVNNHVGSGSDGLSGSWLVLDIYYDDVPSSLASIRAMATAIISPDDTFNAARTYEISAHGRRWASFNLQLDSLSAGTFTWAINGIEVVPSNTGSSYKLITQALLAATAVVSGADDTYEWEGAPFNLFEIVLTPAGGNATVQLKVDMGDDV